jgi:hypothetical protein
MLRCRSRPVAGQSRQHSAPRLLFIVLALCWVPLKPHSVPIHALIFLDHPSSAEDTLVERVWTGSEALVKLASKGQVAVAFSEVAPSAKKPVLMLRNLAAAAVFLHLLAGVAVAATEVVRGHHECEQVRVRGAKVYDAHQSSVRVEQGTCLNTGYRVMNSPDGALWLGGQVIGRGKNRSGSWNEVHTAGNGAALIFENSQNFTVKGLRASWTWDGIRPADQTQNWTVEGNWLDNVRDDAAAENDHCYDGRVLNNLIEDVHTSYSARPGRGDAEKDTSVGVNCDYTLEFAGNLVSLGQHLEDREKRLKYPWANRMGSGQLFKVAGEGAGTKVLLKDNIFKLVVVPNTAKRRLRLLANDWEILPGSGNNVLVWLGGDRIPGLTYEVIDGCAVPKEFQVDRALFTVTCDRQVWEVARERWIAEVWQGAGAATVDRAATK